jgi:hypothetical protein
VVKLRAANNAKKLTTSSPVAIRNNFFNSASEPVLPLNKTVQQLKPVATNTKAKIITLKNVKFNPTKPQAPPAPPSRIHQQMRDSHSTLPKPPLAKKPMTIHDENHSCSTNA